jgi:hypothetical protein
MDLAQIEDLAGGISLIPWREGPWVVCLPLHRRRRRKDEEDEGEEAAGAAGLRAASAALVVSRRGGAVTAGAGAHFFEAVGLIGGAGWNLTLLAFCGVTAVSTSAGRGRVADCTGGGGGGAAAAASGGGGPANAII